MKRMHLAPADHETTTASTAEMLVGTPSTTPPVTLPKHITTALAFLSGCIALLMTGFGIIVPVFPQRLEALGLGAETLALMEGAFGLGMFLFSIPMGTLADRIGRKPIVLISLSGFIVTNLVLATVNIPLVFILIRFVEGVSISGLMPASMAMVGDTVPREKRGRWIGFITAAQAAGFALGPGIGGFLYQAWGFSSAFLISAAIALIASLLALVMLPETLSEHVREQARLSRVKKRQVEKRSNGASPARVPVLLRAFLPLLIVDCGVTFIYPFVLPQYPFFFAKVLGYSVAQFGVIVSVYGLALAAFPMFLGSMSEVFPKKLLIILGSLLYSALNVGMLFLHQYALLIGAATVTGIGNALLIPALSTIYLCATTEQNRSQVMGIRGTAISLGMLLGPLTQALASPWITPQMTFAIGIVLSLVITLYFGVLNPKI
jgi:multidrug resistance protein